MSERTIVGCDPGSENSAVVMLCGPAILQSLWLPNASILTWLDDTLDEDTVLAIETLFPRAEPVSREAMEGQLFAGRCIQIADQRGTPFVKVDVNDAKFTVTGGSPHARKDKHVRLGLLNIFGDSRQVPCDNCCGTGGVRGTRGPKKCPVCKGRQFIVQPGPLHGLNEHCRSALAAAYHVQQIVLRPTAATA